jgi:hypothetical protein
VVCAYQWNHTKGKPHTAEEQNGWLADKQMQHETEGPLKKMEEGNAKLMKLRRAV